LGSFGGLLSPVFFRLLAVVMVSLAGCSAVFGDTLVVLTQFTTQAVLALVVPRPRDPDEIT
jgi:hypothetical protein